MIKHLWDVIEQIKFDKGKHYEEKASKSENADMQTRNTM
jgi:hypothetical protein